jgi:hypothetical protein
MWFVLEYDRRAGAVVSLTTYADGERFQAEEARLVRELALNGEGEGREVVLLQAGSEEALRKTHRRYFEGLATLTAPT